MGVTSWLGTFTEKVDGAGFRIPTASAIASYMTRFAVQAGTLVEGWRRDGQELLVIDLQTGAPQRPFYDIRRIERVGILVGGEDTGPLVCMLRDDFPDTEHQHLVLEDCPATICIDDRPWAEARLTWTPAELIERVLSWFRRVARGELHDARQPLDPHIIGSSLSFIVARSVLDAGPSDLVAQHDPDAPNILRVMPATGGPKPASEPIAIVTYRVSADRMRRLVRAPSTMLALITALRDRGIDLAADLARTLRAWLTEGAPAAWRLNGRFAVIVEMPVISPGGEQKQGMDHRAFVTAWSAADIAVALGLAQPAPAGVGRVGYAPIIGALPVPDEKALEAIEVQSAEVNLAFDADLAA
jgi:hypothetical protein